MKRLEVGCAIRHIYIYIYIYIYVVSRLRVNTHRHVMCVAQCKVLQNK
jgi:hypothetical protein